MGFRRSFGFRVLGSKSSDTTNMAGAAEAALRLSSNDACMLQPPPSRAYGGRVRVKVRNYMSHSLNSLKGGYIRDYIGDY